MFTRRHRPSRRWFATVVLTVLALVATAAIGQNGGQVAVASEAPAIPQPAGIVTADALPTWQINGVVWSQVTVGNIVYATGEFSEARPPGVAKGGPGSVPVSNIIAYDIRTGNPVSSFNHTLNAQGMVITKSPDGSRIYVGGDFTTVDGQPRGHIAAFDTATGALVSSFQPNISGRVRAIAVSNTTVYAGGEFGVANNTPRTRLAAFNPANGALLSWSPSTDNYYVWSMVMTPDQSKVVVGGQFQKINGVTVNGMTALDAQSGAVLPWAANQTIVDWDQGSIMGLSTDGQQIYGSGFAFGTGGKFEGEFALNPDTGAINWLNDCQGDTYDTWPMNGVLYTVSHVHNCEMIGSLPQLSDWGIYQRHALAFSTTPNTVNNGPDQYGWNYKGIPGSQPLTWFPDVSWGNYTVYGQSGWSVTGNGDYLAMGGEFLAVNGKAQQGLVRYAIHSDAPNKMGPVVGYGSTNPTATSKLGGTATVSWNAAWDPDDTTLTYNVYRSGTTAPVYTTTHDGALPWDVPRTNFVDTGLTPGSTYTYTVKVSDPDGNALTLAPTNSVTVASGSASAYAIAVLQDGASAYWRLDEPSGSTVADWAGTNNGVARNGVTRGTVGAIVNDPDTASTFSGTNSGYASAQTQQSGPNTFTVEAWFKTNTNRGGKIIGFGSSTTGDSSSYDRHVYMDNNGRLFFGVYPGSVQTVNTTASYNDGNWHQVVASLGSDGMRLYVDGNLQGQRTDVTSAQAYSGYWRIGGDNLNSWTSQPSSNYFAGAIDEVAVYPSVLTAQQVLGQYTLGTTGQVLNQDPVAAFTSSVNKLAVSLNGTGSTDPDGTVTSYAWDYGDGSPVGSGVTSSHTYSTPGTYPVKLTVTDNDGAKNTVSHDVTVVANKPPVAVFSSSVTGLGATFDGSASTDPDGTISSYAWDFGDGSAAGSGVKPAHTYASAGTYTVTLKVTDDSGATNSTTTKVVISVAGSVPKPDHVVVVVMENRSETNVIGSPDAPYINGLAASGANMTQSFAETHPSQPNYLALFSGSTQGVTDDNCLTNQLTTPNLYDQLAAAGRTFATYSEGLPSVGYTGCQSGNYVRKHNPAVNWASVPASANQPFTAFPSDYSQLPDVSFVVPNLQDDMHDGTIAQGDTWLQQNLGAYVTWAKSHNSVLVLTWDEDDNTALNKIPTVIVGERVKPGDYSDTINHYNVLRTIQDGFGLGTIGASTSSAPITTIWQAAPPANRAPVAVFDSSVNGLTATLDGSGSTDPDGTVASYAWDFGDSSAVGSGVKTTHTYAAAGTYTVKLTVTDNDGATNSVSHDVTVAAAGAAIVVDDFNRSVNDGLGSADTGGAWTLQGPVSRFSVNGTAGSLQMVAGSGTRAYLQSVSAADVDMTVDVSLDKAPQGGSVYTSAVVRSSVDTYYAAKLQWVDASTVRILLTRSVGWAETTLAVKTVTGVSASDVVTVRLQAAGSSPTTVQAKAWKAGTTEPSAWTVSATDSTAALQDAGGVGLVTYLSGPVTNGPIVSSFDNLAAYHPGDTPNQDPAPAVQANKVQAAVTPPKTADPAPAAPPKKAPAPAAPAANKAPVAVVTSSVAGLKVSLDGSGSKDPDGSVASFAWDFGDGTSMGSGAKPHHTYAASGTYTVKLTVTDNNGATDTVSHTVEVVAPQNQSPVAKFDASVAGLKVSLDGSGSKDPDGSIASYAWDFGDDTSMGSGAKPDHTYADSGTYTVKLTVTDNDGATKSTTHHVTVAAGK